MPIPPDRPIQIIDDDWEEPHQAAEAPRDDLGFEEQWIAARGGEQGQANALEINLGQFYAAPRFRRVRDDDEGNHPVGELDEDGNRRDGRDTAQDFQQKYRGCFVLADWDNKKGKGSGVVYVETAGPVTKDYKDTGSQFLIQISDSKDAIIVPETGFHIKKPISSNKFINSGNMCIYFNKSAERQWRRGACASTLTAKNPLERTFELAEQSAVMNNLEYKRRGSKLTSLKNTFLTSPRSTNFSFEQMEQYFRPKYPDFPKAIASILAGEVFSVAFSEQFAIIPSVSSPNLSLVRANVIIAEVITTDEQNKSNYRFVPVGNIFRQEVLDMVKRQGIQNATVA